MNESFSIKAYQALTTNTIYSKKYFSFGLLDGNMSMAIIYALLAKQYNNPNYAAKTLLLLDEISENIASIEDLQFANGLAGIGWGVEWLVQNDLLQDTNTDEVLSNVDDTLYKTIIYKKENNISLLKGTMGKIAYFLKRESSLNPGTHRFKRIAHQECIVLLTDDLQEKLLGESGILEKIELQSNLQNIIDLGNILLLMVAITNINKPTVEAILYETISASEKLLETVDASHCNNQQLKNIDYACNMLYLAICCLITGKKYKYSCWESQAVRYIEKVLPFIITNEDIDEPQAYKKLLVLSLLTIHIPKVDSRVTIKKLIALLSSKQPDFRLYNGVGTIILAELSLANPLLIESWHEIFFIK